jgi:glucosamine kinase
MQTSIAIDAGQNAITTRAQFGDRILASSAPGLDASKPLAPQWADAVNAFLDSHPDVHPVEVGVSTSPLSRATAHELLALLAPRGVQRVAVAYDGVAAYLGALGSQEGAVIHASTVTVCIACGPLGSIQVDGWGPLFGNAGSTFWIGRTAIEAALRGHDGRRQFTALTEMLRADFPDLDGAHLELQASPGLVPRVAAYFPKVDALAATDRVAANILDKAAAHLSEAVQAAIRRAGLTRPNAPKVVALGTVFESTRVRSRFCDYLTLHWPNFALTEPAGDELDGAGMLHTLAHDHPLFGRISYAAR